MHDRQHSFRRRTPGRLFGDLKVRPKLMVLHNLFFLVLAISVYISLIPLLQHEVSSAEERELHIITRTLTTEDYGQGPADTLRIPKAVRAWLDAHPGKSWHDSAPPRETIYQKDPLTGMYRRFRIPPGTYEDVVRRARRNLFIVLGAVYILAVLLLEAVIMPLYVYGPLRRMLNADRATQQGDRDNELIGENLITDDEIGQIMRSRNATILELRKREDDLENALRRLEETADDLKRKNEMLESQDRLVSLGLLSASIAHELNTPLTVLQGSVEKLAETTDDAHTQDRLARMLRVTQRLRKISEGLVDFSRVRKQHMEPIPVRPLIDEAWSLVAIDEKSSTAEFTNFVDPAAAVVGNADRLIQVYVNLIRNALHAIAPSGKIVVRSKRAVRSGKAWISITVEDNGPGIPASVLPDIFEAFVSTRLDARGTGLGLTVAEGIVHQHGGVIAAANRPEGGACLEVALPAAESV